MIAQAGEKRLLERAGDILGHLAIGPHHLLVVGHDAGLDGGGPRASRDRQRGDDARLAQGLLHPLPGGIRPHHSRQHHLAPQRAKVRGDVAGAPQVEALARDLHHRHRSFGGDARHPAPDELVEHEIAHHEHALAAHRAEEAPGAGRGKGRHARGF